MTFEISAGTKILRAIIFLTRTNLYCTPAKTNENMEKSCKSCRICVTETEFNVSLFESYCRRTNMIDKILVCLKIVIEATDSLDTICYKCAENIERYYEFIMFVKKSQTKLVEPRKLETLNRRHVTSYVREQVFDADYTFSFLEIPDEKEEPKPSSPFFSYVSPTVMKQPKIDHVWKTPRSLDKQVHRNDKLKRHCKPNSLDMFESQSQDVASQRRSSDWMLTPDDSILKRVRNKCFGRSDF